jgi:hypothetical protein
MLFRSVFTSSRSLAKCGIDLGLGFGGLRQPFFLPFL